MGGNLICIDIQRPGNSWGVAMSTNTSQHNTNFMEVQKMKPATAKYLYEVWETQWTHSVNAKTNSGPRSTVYKEQNAYYRGITAALDIIASEGYTESRSIREWLNSCMEAVNK